ncbi:hypothetical protein [Halorarum halophilum]|uniref:hypothetical protein n=1 Tax=Halorarum halophilum TaxID=2743090 RepID=UPI001C4F4E9B|nr:hypothetical protein [Halobaculum halophilum]
MSRASSTRLALVVVVSWIVLEYLLRHGGAALAGILLDAPTIGDYLALAVGFPLIAILLSRYALDRGQSRADWEYD